MADQRSAFRFRLPWLPAPRPTIAPRPPAQSTASTTAPAPRRTAETQVPSQPTSTTTLAPAPTVSITPAPAPEATAETQIPSQPTSTPNRNPTPQKIDTEIPTQPTSSTPTSTIIQQAEEVQAPIQSTATTTPSSTTPQKNEIEAPSPNIATTIPTPINKQTAQTQPPSQSTTPTSPTPANTETAQTQPPSQPAATATATATAETTERPPFRPPGVTSLQAPISQPQASRIESQPSSPSNLTSQSRVSSQPASPSRATTQSRSSQSATPSRAASQSRATSQISSPSRTGPPNSLTPRTPSQPRSQSRMPSRSAGQTTSSPSSKAAQGQPTTSILPESTSPSKREPRLNLRSSGPSSSSTENPSSPLEKEQKSAVSDLEQLQPKEEAKPGMIYDSQKQTPVGTSTEPDEIALQSLKGSGIRTTTTFTPSGGPQTSVPTWKSDTLTRSSEPESFPEGSKPEETKEVKEIMQETKEKTHEEARDKDDYLLTRVSGSAEQTKEQPSFTFQSDQAQQTLDRKKIMATPASNGKEIKPTTQTINKTISVESSKKLAMSNGEHIPLHREIRDDISKLVQMMAAQDPKHSEDDKPVSVITLAGENRGATMHLGTDSMKKGEAVPIHRGYKINPDESAETTTDGEGSFKVKSGDAKDIEDQAAVAFVNANVQGINNSIMFNGSITERNPGVHLIHSRFPTKLRMSTAETELPESEKKEFSTTHAQKLTYEPMVRRRCLKGLFLESSDSDPENTTKPRRHGCRVGCKEKGEEKKIDVF